ncbi:MAG: hypothetical protein JSS79_11515 [Bacteroidetes bacterium]|nr:hypothetical protein [Bacteroidota bacterium]
MKMRFVISTVLILAVSCSGDDNTAENYKKFFVKIYNDLNDKIEVVHASFEKIDKHLEIHHIVDSAVVDTCLNFVERVQSELNAIKLNVEASKTFKNDGELIAVTSAYISTMLAKVIPVYRGYYNSIKEEYARKPFSVKNEHEWKEANRRMMKVHLSLADVIKLRYRLNKEYKNVINNWTRKHGRANPLS